MSCSTGCVLPMPHYPLSTRTSTCPPRLRSSLLPTRATPASASPAGSTSPSFPSPLCSRSEPLPLPIRAAAERRDGAEPQTLPKTMYSVVRSRVFVSCVCGRAPSIITFNWCLYLIVLVVKYPGPPAQGPLIKDIEIECTQVKGRVGLNLWLNG